MRASVAFASLSAAVMTACDPITSVSRTATVSRLPSHAAVYAALRDTPSMHSVEVRHENAMSTFSLYKGIVRDPAFEQFLYQGTGNGVVAVRETEKEGKTVRLYSSWMGPRPPKEVFDRTRSYMDVVYESLRRHIPSLPPPSALKEDIGRPPRQ